MPKIISTPVSVSMSYENQDYGARPRRGRYEDYGSPPNRGRSSEYLTEERPRRPIYRGEMRPRYREYEEMSERRPPPRKDYVDRRAGGGSFYGNAPPRRPETSRPCKVLGVFGLSVHTTERDLYNIFSSYGRVRDIQMVYDNLTGRSRGFAFVYYDSTEDARRAKTNCEGGLDIDGKIARVDYSLTTAPHKPTPGVYMGKLRTGFDEDRRRSRPYDRPPRYNRYPGDDGSYDRPPSRFDNSRYSVNYQHDAPPPRRSLRDRSPPRHSRHVSRTGERRRTISSSRSRSPPPVFNGSRKVSEGPSESLRKSGTTSSAGGGGKAVDESWSDAE
ncbi:unnamed protein product [Mesocestoides corti]|uniref:RRM domain-containing protein n=1 Tax=Mesocestoides corti TaxID=53468 RepID=A0A0R3U5A4_MESCO|nr:unnamed protein product [Mesocestoides corti]